MKKINEIKKIKNNSLLVTCLILFSSSLVFATEYVVPNGGKDKVKVNISDKGVNRIGIENDRIAQVIGNEEEYIIESDANLGQIFLTSASKLSKEIMVRFITEKEKIIDTKLVVGKMDPQTIIFRYQGEISNEQVLNKGSTSFDRVGYSKVKNVHQDSYLSQLSGSQSSNSKHLQIIEKIKLVHNNKVEGIKLSSLDCITNKKKLKIKLIEAKNYQIKGLSLIKAIIENTGLDEIYLSESEFSNCIPHVSAIAMSSNKLLPKENMTIYMVGSDGK